MKNCTCSLMCAAYRKHTEHIHIHIQSNKGPSSV